MTFEEFNSIPCTYPACSGITFDETVKMYVKEHRPQPKEDDIWKALLALRNACDMRTELGTHVLFDALLEACKRVKRKQYNCCVKDGLDVTIPLAKRILEVMREREPIQIYWAPDKASLVDWDRRVAEKKLPL